MSPLPTHLNGLSSFICLAGPTASGKTAAALAIAKEIPCEIISVDSALIYQGMDIGTAKPTQKERQLVPHHLIDIRQPFEAYSVAEFLKDTCQLIQDITTRQKLPLLVGGTMMYFHALATGLDDTPAAEPALRYEIEQKAMRLGWPAMHLELSKFDPKTASRLSPFDSQRIQRAIEVYLSTGKPLSDFHQRHHRSNLPFPLIALEPENRAWLHARIEQRFELMMKEGFLDEVKTMRYDDRLTLQLPSIRCVGYRQAWEALDGSITLDEFKNKAICATRQLAKRQITWLRGMKNRKTLVCDQNDVNSQALKMVQEILNSAKK